MKQGTNFELPVNIDVDLDEVERIDFLFVQGDVTKTFTYPSETAVRDGNTIKLTWTEEDTWAFKTSVKIEMDTKVKMQGTINNPETAIVSFGLHPTLFARSE